MTAPATPEEAEALARNALADYLAACGHVDNDPVSTGNYLSMLVRIVIERMTGVTGPGVLVLEVGSVNEEEEDDPSESTVVH